MFSINTTWDDGIGGCLNFGPLEIDIDEIKGIVIKYKNGEEELLPFGAILDLMKASKQKEGSYDIKKNI